MIKNLLRVAPFVVALALIPMVSSAQATACADITSLLKYGSANVAPKNEVSLLQTFLAGEGYFTQNPPAYYGALPTGTFYAATQQAVKNFQIAEGISPVTGETGTTTRDKIKGISCLGLPSARQSSGGGTQTPTANLMVWKWSTPVPTFTPEVLPSPLPPNYTPARDWTQCDPPPPYPQTKYNASEGASCTDVNLHCVSDLRTKFWSCTDKPTPTVFNNTAAISIQATTTTIGSTVNPHGLPTTAWVRFSTTNPGTCNDTFGTRVPASGGQALDTKTAGASFTTLLTGLTPYTTYYYCTIASNTNGKSYGSVGTSKTLPTGPVTPTWEQSSYNPASSFGMQPPTCTSTSLPPNVYVGMSCNNPGAGCVNPTARIAWSCVDKSPKGWDIVGRVIDYGTRLGVADADVQAWSGAPYAFAMFTKTDASGNYRIAGAESQQRIIRADKTGYITGSTWVPAPTLDNGRMVAHPDDVMIVNQVDPNYVGPLVNIQSDIATQPIRALNGNRNILFETTANFTFKGLGPNGKMCQAIVIDPDPSRVVKDGTFCNKLLNYRDLDDAGYTYNAATDEWKGSVLHNLANGYNIDTKYVLALYNPGNPAATPAVMPRAASLDILVTAFASEADNVKYAPILENGLAPKPIPQFPDTMLYIGESYTTKYMNTPTQLAVTGAAAGASVTLHYEKPIRAGDEVVIDKPTGVANAQGQYATMVTVKGRPRTVYFEQEVSGKRLPAGSQADFHYSAGQGTPTMPLPNPTLTTRNQETGAIATNGSNVDFTVGQTAVHSWTGGCPAGRTCTYSSTAVATQDPTPGAVSCNASLATFDPNQKVGVVIPWSANQSNGASGGQSWPVYPFQKGCRYVITFTVKTDQDVSKSASVLVTIRSTGGAAPVVSGQPTPTLTTKDKETNAVASSGGSVSAKVGETLIHQWAGGCPVDSTCTYTSQWIASQDSTAGAASCSANLATVGLKMGTVYPWTPNQANGAGGTETAPAMGYQKGCTFALMFTVAANGGSSRTASTIVTITGGTPATGPGEPTSGPTATTTTGKIYIPGKTLLTPSE